MDLAETNQNIALKPQSKLDEIELKSVQIWIIKNSSRDQLHLIRIHLKWGLKMDEDLTRIDLGLRIEHNLNLIKIYMDLDSLWH
jgi:uncharacterized FAD-dependent dehydrogenase